MPLANANRHFLEGWNMLWGNVSVAFDADLDFNTDPGICYRIIYVPVARKEIKHDSA